MELIKAAVDSMKGLNKEELNKLFSSLSEDEVDESLTKAEVARKIVEALKEMSLEEVTKLVKEMGYEDEEDMEDMDKEIAAEGEDSDPNFSPGCGQIFKGPYVRNCTNFMTGSIGKKINGAPANAAFTGTNDGGQDLKSMVCDSFTQYNLSLIHI